MSKNIKIGTKILQNKEWVRFLDADNQNTYDYFYDTSDATAIADKILEGYTAYVNGGKITGTNPGGGGGGAKLNSPTISLNGSVLTLTNGNNGSFASTYNLLSDGQVVETFDISTQTIDLANYITSGSHTVTVSVSGQGMLTSNPSNSVTYPTVSSNFLLSNGDYLDTSEHQTFNVTE